MGVHPAALWSNTGHVRMDPPLYSLLVLQFAEICTSPEAMNVKVYLSLSVYFSSRMSWARLYLWYVFSDGNSVDGDGCSSKCTFEPFFSCSGSACGKNDTCWRPVASARTFHDNSTPASMVIPTNWTVLDTISGRDMAWKVQGHAAGTGDPVPSNRKVVVLAYSSRVQVGKVSLC